MMKKNDELESFNEYSDDTVKERGNPIKLKNDSELEQLESYIKELKQRRQKRKAKRLAIPNVEFGQELSVKKDVPRKKRSVRKKKSVKKRTSVSKKNKKYHISTSKLMKMFDDLHFETIEGTTTAFFKDKKHNKKYLITQAQQIELLKRRNQERLERIHQARERANLMSRMTAKYGHNGHIQGLDIISYADTKVRALMLGFFTRYRVRRMNRSAIRIQRWYRRHIENWRRVRSVVINQIEKRKIDNVRFELSHFAVSYYHRYQAMMRTQLRVYTWAAAPLQCYLRAIPAFQKQQQQRRDIILVQSFIRSHLIKKKDAAFTKKSFIETKHKVMKLYESFYAPYTKRALFCYATKEITKGSLLIASEQLAKLKARKELFMHRDKYLDHLDSIVNELDRCKRDPNLVQIIARVYQPTIKPSKAVELPPVPTENRRRGLFSRFSRSAKSLVPDLPPSEDQVEDTTPDINPDTGDFVNKPVYIPVPSTMNYVNKLEHLPFSVIMKQIVKYMFSPNASIERVNWSAVIMFNYVMKLKQVPKTTST